MPGHLFIISVRLLGNGPVTSGVLKTGYRDTVKTYNCHFSLSRPSQVPVFLLTLISKLYMQISLINSNSNLYWIILKFFSMVKSRI